MSSASPHRIDPPSVVTPHMGGPYVATVTAPLARSKRLEQFGPTGDADLVARESRNLVVGDVPISEVVSGREEWLRLHAAELVDRLQTWADELDTREAKLNARSSIQDQRERRFRLEQQNAEIELSELRRSTERLRCEVETHARRLAFQPDSPDF